MRRRSGRGTMMGIVGMLVSLAVAVMSAVGLAGKPARLVDIMTIFGGGMGAGASLVSTIRSLRDGRTFRTQGRSTSPRP